MSIAPSKVLVVDKKFTFFEKKYHMIDKASDIRKGEELDLVKLNAYLKATDSVIGEITNIQQFHGGFSNLTYQINSATANYVLRRPPFGANIKSAHDMGREFEILTKVRKEYDKAPKPMLMCTDQEVMGCDFYIMEKVNGIIYKNAPGKAAYINEADSLKLANSVIDNFAQLHSVNLEATGLDSMGRPEGYIDRQVTGWIKRYRNAQTSEVAALEHLIEWLPDHKPSKQITGFIHNDYKLDNIMFDAERIGEIKAVLDWEMSTVGDVLMDLGTAMFYWAEPDDHVTVQQFNPYRALSKNLTREAAIQRYSDKSGLSIDDFLFYYAFGGFKLCVIIQQIYQRFVKGLNKNKAMANFDLLVEGFGINASNAVKLGRISRLS